MSLLKLLLVATVCLAAAHDDWGEKCPDPLHMEESDGGPFRSYDQDKDGNVSEEEVIAVYTNGNQDVPVHGTVFHAKEAFQQLDIDGDGKIDEKEFNTAGEKQMCVGPKLGADGHCPPPFILDGEKEFFRLQAAHYELRKLTWHNMIGMGNEELRNFMRKHDVPYTVRIKVLDLHDDKGGHKNQECIPVPPSCHAPLEFHEEDGSCRPPKPHYINPIINDAWVQPPLVVDGEWHNEKTARLHQPVQGDPNDELMIKERHETENALWNWEKVRKHTAH